MGFPFGQKIFTASASDSMIDVFDSLENIKRIGIQGEPYSHFILNGKDNYIGLTGIFEYQGTLNSLKVVSNKSFIVDYEEEI